MELATVNNHEIEASSPRAPLTVPKTQASHRLDLKVLNIELGSDYLLWSLVSSIPLRKSEIRSGTVSENKLSDPVVAARLIGELIDSLGLRRGDVNLYLSLPEAMLRSFYVPFVPKNELRQVVIWEGNRVYPFDLDKELFDWRVISSVEWSGTKKYQVQGAAVPAAKLMPVCDTIAAKGLTLRKITFTALAWESYLSKYQKDLGISPSSSTAIVRLLGNKLNVLCFHKGSLEFTRENVIEGIESGKEFEASLQFLDEAGSTAPGDSLIQTSVDARALARTVTDDLDYYYGQFSQRIVDTVLLSLPSVNEKEIADSISEALGVTVRSIFVDKIRKNIPSDLSLNLLMPSILNQKGMAKRLDLLPHKFVVSLQEKKRFKASLYALGLVILLLSSLSFLQNLRKSDLERQRTQQQEMSAGVRTSPAYQSLANLLNVEAKWQSELAQLHKTKPAHAEILKAISNLTPPDIFLVAINLQAISGADGQQTNAITIAGFVTNADKYLELRLAEYLKSLRGIPCCNKLELKNQYTTLSDQGKRLEFNIAMEVGNCGK